MSSIPPVADLVFAFRDVEIARFPNMIFTTFLEAKGKDPQKEQKLLYLASWADCIGKHPFMSEKELITYLQDELTWKEIQPYIVLSKDSESVFTRMWVAKQSIDGDYAFHIRTLQCPKYLYRYIPYSRERLEQIFCHRKLYFQSHAFFNDPFDCNFDADGHYATLDWGMICLSELNNHVLMYSHYADSHKGLCLRFDTSRLNEALNNDTHFHHLRPVFYCAQTPKIDFKKHPALFTTCKDSVWAYEKEYRIFLVKGDKPLPYGEYAFDPSAITSITFGCRATEETIASTRRIASAASHNIDYFLAKQKTDRFGITCEPYPTH